jgi:hypothetical protein
MKQSLQLLSLLLIGLCQVLFAQEEPSISPSASSAPSGAPSSRPSSSASPSVSQAPSTSAAPTLSPVDQQCAGYGESCVFAIDCCSDRCVINLCQKSSLAGKTKLATGRGGSGGAAPKMRAIRGRGKNRKN